MTIELQCFLFWWASMFVHEQGSDIDWDDLWNQFEERKYLTARKWKGGEDPYRLYAFNQRESERIPSDRGIRDTRHHRFHIPSSLSLSFPVAYRKTQLPHTCSCKRTWPFLNCVTGGYTPGLMVCRGIAQGLHPTMSSCSALYPFLACLPLKRNLLWKYGWTSRTDLGAVQGFSRARGQVELCCPSVAQIRTYSLATTSCYYLV